MKKTLLFVHMILIAALATLIGCGGGGGGGSSSAPPAPATKAIVTLSTTGTLSSGVQIGGIQARINLPAGVTVKATPSVQNNAILMTDTGVIIATGNAAGAELTSGLYSTGTATATHVVSLAVAKSSGFTPGEFAQVSCDITAGSAPAAADFTLTNVTIAELLTGATITGLEPKMTITFQ